MASKYANCQFCEGSADVKWHCNSCDLNLCDICNTKIHTRSEKLSEHKVELLKDVESNKELENVRKVNLKEIACSKHLDQKCVTYCLNCDKSLCASCLIRPFQYEKLNKVYEEKYILLKDLQSKIDECFPFFEEKADDFRKKDDNEVDKQNEIKEKLFKRKNEVKDAVTTEALALEEVMKSIWDADNNPIKTERERLCQVEQDLKARKKVLHEATQTQEPALVFSTADNIRRDIPEKSVLKVTPPELYYIEPVDVNMERILGSIINKPKVVLIETFEVDFPEINGLVSLNDDICVMYNKDCRRFKYFTISDLKFVTTKNDIIDESKKNIHEYVKIMDITSYKEEVVLSDDTFQMRRLNNNGTFENISPSFSKDKLAFYGIHAANDYEIIVGFTNKGMKSTGILELTDIDYSKNKYGIRRVECDKGNFFKQLFTVPIKITTDTNGDIFVIDEEDYSRSVVSIGKWGQPKWTYIGHKSLNPVSAAAVESEDDDKEEEERQEKKEEEERQEKKEDFYPNDIVTTSSGLVLVSEEETNAIHVLSNDGQFICNCLSDSEIIAPVSICFNNKGQLMIGCSDSGETKLHIVNFYE